MRGYSDGTYRLDVAVQNTLDIASANSVTYDVSIVAGSTTVYSKSNVLHSYMTRWRKVFAIAGLTEANVTPDTAPMIAAGAVPKFLTSVPQDGYQIANTADYDILGPGGLIKHMPDTGGRPDRAVPGLDGALRGRKTHAARVRAEARRPRRQLVDARYEGGWRFADFNR